MTADNSRLNQSEKTRAREPSDEWLAGWRAAKAAISGWMEGCAAAARSYADEQNGIVGFREASIHHAVMLEMQADVVRLMEPPA